MVDYVDHALLCMCEEHMRRAQLRALWDIITRHAEMLCCTASLRAALFPTSISMRTRNRDVCIKGSAPCKMIQFACNESVCWWSAGVQPCPKRQLSHGRRQLSLAMFEIPGNSSEGPATAHTRLFLKNSNTRGRDVMAVQAHFGAQLSMRSAHKHTS